MTAQTRVRAAIQQLTATDGRLADVLAAVTAVVAEEATQNPEFRARLAFAFGIDHEATAPAAAPAPAKARASRSRRPPGPWDPYVVYADVGEAGLRDRLGELELEQLRNIVAEHGMNNDGLVMKWRKADRVVDRIVERVVVRAQKGDAFRTA